MTLRCTGAIAAGDLVVEIDLDVAPGETVALVGPNGAGKSTVLHCIAGLGALRSGTVAVGDAVWDDGADTFVPPAARSVGTVFQSYRLFSHLDALDNVAFGLRARGVARAGARSAALSALENVGVAEAAHLRPGELSGGQAQRVALARALVVEPSVLLLDEPMAALDASVRASIRRGLADWLDASPACRLLVTHDPIDAYALADRVVVLEAGRVTQRGTIHELAAAPRSPYVADLLGTNLVRGTLTAGDVAVDGGGHLSVGAHAAADGRVVATIRPAAIALHRHRPDGSPRNVWSTTVDGVDAAPDRVRVRLGAPLPLVVEITAAGHEALDADPGDAVWASVKASEIGVVADA